MALAIIIGAQATVVGLALAVNVAYQLRRWARRRRADNLDRWAQRELHRLGRR